MNDIIITKASLADAQTIKSIGSETFYETFADSNTKADMQKYLNENFNDDKITNELINLDSDFFIAWDGGEAIGYLKLNSGIAQTEIQDGEGMEIERIYVLKKHQGKKVGQLLYQKALDIALQANKAYIWLGVWENNNKAIRFYTKNGFVAFSKHVFNMGGDLQTDVMMKKQL